MSIAAEGADNHPEHTVVQHSGHACVSPVARASARSPPAEIAATLY